ncbi:hypothetical protein ACJMK2_042834 [Sinanodonta woodiana]|uniref:Uncharacterized protein n=1 Tax=Sinanodonta woodiana TaxID=1069815 RepID=A0ABD3VV13_SINWO
MSHLQGRWAVAKEENLDALFAASNVDSALREKTKEGLIKPEQEIVVNGDDYALTTHVGHISTTIRFKLNVEFPASSLDGRKNMINLSIRKQKKNDALKIGFVVGKNSYER